MNGSDIKPWLSDLYCVYNQQRLLVTLTVWALWLSYNKLMHDGKRQSVLDLCTFVLGHVNELELLEKTYLEKVQEPRVQWCLPEP